MKKRHKTRRKTSLKKPRKSSRKNSTKKIPSRKTSTRRKSSKSFKQLHFKDKYTHYHDLKKNIRKVIFNQVMALGQQKP